MRHGPRFGFHGRGEWGAFPDADAPAEGPPLVQAELPPPRAVAGELAGGNALRFRTRIARFLTLTVDAEGGAAFATGQDGSLRHYSYPDFRLLGTYALPCPAYLAALDAGRGLLHVAGSQPRFLSVNALGDRERARGDLAVYDVRAVQQGKVPEGATLQPRAELTLAAHVFALALAPDGKELYYLARVSRTVQLGRVETELYAAAEARPMPHGTGALALAADGRTLYATPPGELWSLEGRPLRVTQRLGVPGAELSLAVGRDGRVFVAACEDEAEVLALDVARRRSVGRWALPVQGRVYLNVAPDGRHLFLGNSAVAFSRVSALLLPEGEGAPRPVGEAGHDQAGLVTGASALSPDGRFLINAGGKVFEVGADS
jgi:hypothetical protein